MNCSIRTMGSFTKRFSAMSIRLIHHWRLRGSVVVRHLSRASATVVIAVAVLSVCATASHAVEGSGPIQFRADHAAFRYAPDSRDGYVEFYFELKRVNLAFRPVDSVLRADVHAWVRVTDTTGTPIDSIGGAFVSVAADSAALADSNFVIFFALLSFTDSNIFDLFSLYCHI